MAGRFVPALPEAEPALPAAVPAFRDSVTHDDTGWRCCRTCDVEWTSPGETPCFLDPSHPGDPGRLGSWCRHGLRRVPGPGARTCLECRVSASSDFTPEFLDALARFAEAVLADDSKPL